jgi:hypothetical protein
MFLSARSAIGMLELWKNITSYGNMEYIDKALSRRATGCIHIKYSWSAPTAS